MFNILDLLKQLEAAATARGDYEDEAIFDRAITALQEASALIDEPRYQVNIIPNLKG